MTGIIAYDSTELDRFIDDMRADMWAASPESLDAVERRLRCVVDNIVDSLNVQPHAPDFGSDS